MGGEWWEEASAEQRCEIAGDVRRLVRGEMGRGSSAVGHRLNVVALCKSRAFPRLHRDTCGALMMQPWNAAQEPTVWLLMGQHTKVKAHFIPPLRRASHMALTSIHSHNTTAHAHMTSIFLSHLVSMETLPPSLINSWLTQSCKQRKDVWLDRRSLSGDGTSALCPTCMCKYSSPEPDRTQAAGTPVFPSDLGHFPKPPSPLALGEWANIATS